MGDCAQPTTPPSADIENTESTSPRLPPLSKVDAAGLESELLTAEATDNDGADDDSAIEDNVASSTASMRSSILQYRQENGRT
ncbi:hypothetical protein EDB81DRAFT_890953 [Dactylonectria macrodidyma]|uniref:Uncharacterized protein n=1 Tax=Dactylonectria macrodidyma TaxID=307937 RepID=A0A9P9IIG7_9HYPO|nr:hypothetical protein EDB81DRAFT_890953 [Dactylonectria macrodidyma]